jgi:hypothetical protein
MGGHDDFAEIDRPWFRETSAFAIRMVTQRLTID